RGAVALAPGAATGMAMGAEMPPPQPAAIATAPMGAEVLRGVHGARPGRFVGGIGSGGAGGGTWGWAASCSHRAPCGRWVGPVNGLGSLERARRGGLGGTIGWRRAAA